MGPGAVPHGPRKLIEHPSPNQGARRQGARPDMVVLHHTAMASAEAALARLCAPAHEVSAHYLIDEAGRVYALVPEARRAWHAGAGSWGGVCDVNSRSIGIELQNDARSPYGARQMAALEALLADVLARNAIPPHRVIGHSDMAPARKSDPGARFDWRRLALSGLSVWPRPAVPARPEETLPALHCFGYDGADAALLLRAFRLRFRPQAAENVGPADAMDAALACDLARRFGVDRDARGA